jgi:serine/threonine-protein kinase
MDTGSAKLPGPGDVVDGKFVLERLLGQGGMGAVYAARHNRLGHAVAIKLMLASASNVEATRRFLNEGRAAVNIQHDNVVRGSDLGEENGYAFMVLELLDGEDLDQVLEREIRLAPHVAVDYVIQALRGVAQAHAKGIVHRDLKPANLFLARRPDGGTIVKVLDFGISKAATGSALEMAPNQLTSTATMLGSPLYMSPEQLRSSKKVDARADIWAIGVILYELVSGERPFNGDTLGELFSSILETEAPRLSTRVPSTPQGLDAIVARCLQRRPEDRYQSAVELERELAPFAVQNASMGNASALAFSTVPQPGQFASNTGQHPTGATTGAAPYGSQSQSNPSLNAMPGAASSPADMARSSPSFGGGGGGQVMPGTVPLGMMSPASFQQTTGSGSAWQTAPAPTNSSKAPAIFIGVCVVLALVGGGGLFAASKLRKGVEPTAASSSTPSSVAASAAPPETVALPAAVAPSADPAPPPSSAPAVAATAPKHHGGPTIVAPTIVAPKIEPPKIEPPKIEPPKIEPPKVEPKPKPAVSASPQQNSR